MCVDGQRQAERGPSHEFIDPARPPHIRLLGCGAPPVVHIYKLIRMIQAIGCTCDVVLTPDALQMMQLRPDDTAAIDYLTELTGFPVRVRYGTNWEERTPTPRPTVFMAVPATVNTVDKAAAGIGDTLVAGILVEKIGALSIGRQVELAVMPFTNKAHAAHPRFRANLSQLRSWGVTVVDEMTQGYELPEGSTKGAAALAFPWEIAFDALVQCLERSQPEIIQRLLNLSGGSLAQAS